MDQYHWNLPTSRVEGSRWAGAALGLYLLSGCMSYGGHPGGYSQPYPDRPYPDQSIPGQYGANQLTGTVQGVDLNNSRLMLATEAHGFGGSRQVELYFDQRTQLVYQGRAQSIGGLEAGDRIRVEAAQSNGRLWARTIEVVDNVRDDYDGYQDGSGYQNGGNYGAQGGNLRGTIGYVDSRARVIEIDSGGYGGGRGNRLRVQYDERTVVEYQGQRYRPESLERGDLVRIQARHSGDDWLAERIWVESDISR